MKKPSALARLAARVLIGVLALAPMAPAQSAAAPAPPTAGAASTWAQQCSCSSRASESTRSAATRA
eukprot:6855139-Pyramimonas_sp.AAC.1